MSWVVVARARRSRHWEVFALLALAVFSLAGCDFIMDLFKKTYTLQVITSGSGQVNVSPQRSEYDDGTRVTLTAAPADGYLFVGALPFCG